MRLSTTIKDKFVEIMIKETEAYGRKNTDKMALFNTYKNVYVHKTLDKDNIPYHLNPLVYDIHGKYLKSKQPTTWQIIKDYIHTMPSKKLAYAMNYL